MPENPPAHSASTGHSRRTVLKASAWSVPVIAAATAIPLAAASLAADQRDLRLLSQPDGDTIIGSDGEGSTLIFAVPPGFDATTLGSVDTPAGSTLILSFDARLLAGPTVQIEGQPAALIQTSTTGDVTVASFSLPSPIPANGISASITVTFDTINLTTWLPPMPEPYVATIVAPSGITETDTTNNSVAHTGMYSQVVG